MNITLLFFWSIIIIYIADFVLELVLEFLNSKKWTDKLPKELEGIFDEEKFKKQQLYEKDTTRFSLFKATIFFLAGLVILFQGIPGKFDVFLRTYIENELWLGLSFFGITFFAFSIISIPFSIYSTFVIEEKYGFNKTTAKIFIADFLKGWLLTALIGGPILLFIIWFYINTGELFWIYVLALVTFVSLFFTLFYSNIIVPLFNKQTPLAEGELKSKIKAACNNAKFTLKDIYVIDGSKRSSRANAYFTGLGPKKRIVLFDTLINDLNHDEIVAVLMHEIGHFKKKHIPYQIILSIIQTAIVLYILSLFIGIPELSFALGGNTSSFHLGIIGFGLIYTPISLITGLLGNILSRKFEYQADNFASSYNLGTALISALKKLSVNNLSNPLPHPIYVFFHYSHPPLLERIKNLEK